MRRSILYFLLSVIASFSVNAQSTNCADSEPFCTGTVYTFPAGVTGSAEPGPNYGCLTTQPAPAWYHMLIEDPGDIDIYMYSTPSEDIDFICWGPFTDPVQPCPLGLTASKIVDCSYSLNATETCNIPDAQTGEYYILMITNFSRNPCDITFSQTGGQGSTDCTILPPLVSNNGPLCTGETLQLNAESINNATYSWTGPNGFTSNLEDPIIMNVDLDNAGDYSCVITVNGNPSDPAVTTVVIHQTPVPGYEYTEVCYTVPTQFTDLSSIEPPAEITSWSWDFDDNGATSSEQNPSYTFSQAGMYDVKLTVTNEGNCPRSLTQQVEVYQLAEAYAGEDQQIPFGWSTQLNGEANGGSGDYSFHWEPQDLLVNPHVLNPATVNLESTTEFILTITDNASGCESTDEVVVNVTGGALAVNASASPQTICNGQRTELSALASGGAGSYNYSWTSDPPGFTSQIAEPFAYPEETTTYFVEVGDGANYVTASITVNVKPTPTADAGPDRAINAGTSTTINGSASGGTGDFTYQWQPADSLIDATLLSPATELLYTTTEFKLVVYDQNGCQSEEDNMVLSVGGDVLSVSPNATDDVICYGESTGLAAYATGGSGNYEYEWTINGNFVAGGQNITVNPPVTTTYEVKVFDGFKNATGEISIQVDPLPEVDLVPEGAKLYSEDTIIHCIYDSVFLDAGNPGAMYEWSNGFTDKILGVGTSGIGFEVKTFSVMVINTVTGCENADTLTIISSSTECTGIEDEVLNNNLLEITPNPAEHQIYIAFRDNYHGILNLEVSNLQGEKVLFRQIDVDPSQNYGPLDLSGLSKGVYILKIYGRDVLYTEKIILQ